MSMDGVLRLLLRESNLPTPEYIKRAAIRRHEEGYTFYTENAGLPLIARAISHRATLPAACQDVALDPRRSEIA